jgi:hypothetical protein
VIAGAGIHQQDFAELELLLARELLKIVELKPTLDLV